ncbi:MAG TPA: ferredoxin [Clostridiales bacterium]|nr:ferredoxin [Clostridiales bacterium]HCW51934.1 ferredoxin [Clostridiales bacterium]
MVKSLEELAKIREQAKKALAAREGEAETKIVVGMGTCGIAAGAREVMAAILDELAKRDLGTVTVTQTGCVGLCDKEPLVDVIKPGQPKVTYGRVDAERARRIVAQHVVNDQVVGEWVVGTSS